jgi:pyruvate formate lyase activating enzyme
VTTAALAVAGLTRLTTCDWPGRLAAAVFLQGCPWRCGYCQNPGLIDPAAPGQIAWPAVTAFLARRRGLLDGVVFSGGEPTRQPALAPAMAEVRALGFAVGLHTAGAYPRRLAAVLPLTDWVGLDVKALPDGYAAVTGAAASADRAYAALRLVTASGVDHEVRVTVDPTRHTAPGLRALVARLQAEGAARIVLQEARAQGASPAYAAALAGRRLRDVIDPPPPGVTVRGPLDETTAIAA